MGVNTDAHQYPVSHAECAQGTERPLPRAGPVRTKKAYQFSRQRFTLEKQPGLDLHQGKRGERSLVDDNGACGVRDEPRPAASRDDLW